MNTLLILYAVGLLLANFITIIRLDRLEKGAEENRMRVRKLECQLSIVIQDTVCKT
jgi:hypothetical protein